MLYEFRTGNWYVKHAGPANWTEGVNVALYGSNVTFQCGGPGHFPMLGNVFSDGTRAIVWKRSDTNFYVKSLGGESWGAIPVTSTLAGRDVKCQNGGQNDVPLVGNVFGDGMIISRRCHYSP